MQIKLIVVSEVRKAIRLFLYFAVKACMNFQKRSHL